MVIKGLQGISTAAEYGNRVLTFNVSKLGTKFFDKPVSNRVLDLVIHELGHEFGMHTEKSYHQAISKLGAELTMIGLKDSKFFNNI